MNTWDPARASRVFAALLRIGWSVKRQSRSHRTLQRPEWPDLVFPFHTHDELGTHALTRIAARTGLRPGDV